jgi:hypothetical protein
MFRFWQEKGLESPAGRVFALHFEKLNAYDREIQIARRSSKTADGRAPPKEVVCPVPAERRITDLRLRDWELARVWLYRAAVRSQRRPTGGMSSRAWMTATGRIADVDRGAGPRRRQRTGPNKLRMPKSCLPPDDALSRRSSTRY